jgi:hypothetical protein
MLCLLLSKGSVAPLSPKYIFPLSYISFLVSILTELMAFKLIDLFEVNNISLDLALNNQPPRIKNIWFSWYSLGATGASL